MQDLNYTEHLIILASTVICCVSFSALASLVGILAGIASSAMTIKICIIIAGIRKYKSVIKKKKKKHEEIVLLAETKLNTIEVVICKGLNIFKYW